MQLDTNNAISGDVGPVANAGLLHSSPYHLLQYPSKSSLGKPKTRILLSCDTGNDLRFVTEFCERYSQHFRCTIVEPFNRQQANRMDYVFWLATERALARNTVLVVLVGPTTAGCANVDWDIAASLTDSGLGTAGLVGVLLPNYFESGSEAKSLRNIPHRLALNTSNGYATVYTWQHVMSSLFNAESMVRRALENSRSSQFQPNNRPPLRKP